MGVLLSTAIYLSKNVLLYYSLKIFRHEQTLQAPVQKEGAKHKNRP